MPDLVDRSLINAEVVLKSNELVRGKIIYEPSPFQNLVKEMQHGGITIAPGTRIQKGAVIDLVVGDGNGPADFVVGSLIGDSFERAKFKLGGWDLHLGNVEIPEGMETLFGWVILLTCGSGQRVTQIWKRMAITKVKKIKLNW
jgi:beta-lactam-binding protein with PASTA domain